MTMTLNQCALLTSLLPREHVPRHLGLGVEHGGFPHFVKFVHMSFNVAMQPTFFVGPGFFLVHLGYDGYGGVVYVVQFDIVSTVHLKDMFEKSVVKC